MGKKLKILLILVITAMVNADLFPQTEKQLLPSDIKQQTIVTEPVTLMKGFLRAGFQVSYRVADKYFNGSGKKDYFEADTSGSNSAYNITLQYGITDRLQVDITTEYLYSKLQTVIKTVNPGTNTDRNELITKKGLGFGDSRIAVRYQLLRESKNKISLTAVAGALIPTGEKDPENVMNVRQYDLPVGNGNFALVPSLLARYIIYPYSFTAFVNYTYNFSGSKKMTPTASSESEFRYGNILETGFTTNLHLNDWIVFTNEFTYYHEGQGEINNTESRRLAPSWAVIYKPNLYFQVRKFRLAESVAIPLRGMNAPSDPMFVMLVQYIF